MFFEGAEKRILIIFKSNIRKYYNTIWWKIHIKDIGCNIISMMSNKYYDIYLLSESILLVSKNTILIKTCGITSPLSILNFFNSDNIKNIAYSHPNFLNIEEQPIMYQNPNYIINYINEKINLDLEYNKFGYLNYIGNYFDINYSEIILWDFEWNDDFILVIKKFLVEWDIDDYIFQPQGYSLNGFKNKDYITIHCTPNKECSYISIEYKSDTISIDLFKIIIDMLNPQKVGIITKNKELYENIIIKKTYKYIYTNNIYIKFYS
jgi:S-adenosylmethionine decarboxylase